MGEGLIVRRGGSGKGKPEGQFVWVKKDRQTATVTGTVATLNPFVIQMSGNYTAFVESDFVGKTIQLYPNGDFSTAGVKMTLKSGGVANLYQANGSYWKDATWSYAPTTGKLTTNYKSYDKDGINFTTSKTAETVICFVVDDDASAYPNGAFHTDGYYYELIGQVDSANVMSLSDGAVATVQNDYRTQVEGEVSQ